MTPFKRAYRRTSLFLLAASGGALAFVLTCSHTPATTTNPTSDGIAHTTLTRGVKDLWLSQEGERLQTRIASEESTVAFLPHQQGLEVIECMNGVTSWMQRKVSREGQQVRYLEADEATFLYQSQRFLTQNVALTLYNTPGKVLSLDIPTSGIIMKGRARELQFKMGTSASSELFATDFQAEVNTP